MLKAGLRFNAVTECSSNRLILKSEAKTGFDGLTCGDV